MVKEALLSNTAFLNLLTPQLPAYLPAAQEIRFWTVRVDTAAWHAPAESLPSPEIPSIYKDGRAELQSVLGMPGPY